MKPAPPPPSSFDPDRPSLPQEQLETLAELRHATASLGPLEPFLQRPAVRFAFMGLVLAGLSLLILFLFTLEPGGGRYGPSLSQRLEAFWPRYPGLVDFSAWFLPFGALTGALSWLLLPLRQRRPAATVVLALAGGCLATRATSGISPEKLDGSTAWMAPAVFACLLAANAGAGLIRSCWEGANGWLAERFGVRFGTEFAGDSQYGQRLLLSFLLLPLFWFTLEAYHLGWDPTALLRRARVAGTSLLLLLVLESPRRPAADGRPR